MSDTGNPVSNLVTIALNAVGARRLDAHAATAFYEPPAEIPSVPGTLLREEPSTFYLDPFRLIAAPARVRRIMFSTTDRVGQPIAVTGTILTPTRPRTRRPDRPLVAFAVGTQGMGSQCAPSRQMAAGREYESLFLAGLLARGFNVVVPDYQGLGMSGVHTYMSREVQGHVVLDALRAARQSDLPDIPVDGPLAITGYSQGGGAAASAAEMAHVYAPELVIAGTVAGAVPADLSLTARLLDGGPYFAFLGYALAGLTGDYGVALDGILNAHGLEVVARLREQCMFESLRTFAFTKSSTLTVDGRSVSRILRDEPYATMVADQQLGNGRAPRMPVLLIHSKLDDVVPYEAGRALAERWVGQGARVRLSTFHAPTHAAAAVTSYGSAFTFLNRTFAGQPMRANTRRYLQDLAEGDDYA
ncbi:MAG: lipase family protein [Marmoricola sp.]